MSALQQLLDLLGNGGDGFRTIRLSIEHLDTICPRVAFQKSEWNNHRFPCNLGLAESGDSFFEDTDNRKSQFTDSNILPNGIHIGKHITRERFREKANLAMRLHIVDVEVTPGDDDQ